MNYVTLTFELTSDLRLKAVTVDHNDTELNGDSDLLKGLAFALLECLSTNKESILVQDILNDLNIPRKL
jgi:lantibiotic modifying enzyme